MMTLGKSEENNDWQVFAILMSQVLNRKDKKQTYIHTYIHANT